MRRPLRFIETVRKVRTRAFLAPLLQGLSVYTLLNELFKAITAMEKLFGGY